MTLTSRSLRLLTAALMPATILAAETPAVSTDPLKVLLSYEWVGMIIPPDAVREPSGIVYHPIRKTLYVVGDEGDIHEFKTDGTPVNSNVRSEGRIDYEGITVNPATGMLYVAVEGRETIVEIDPQTLATTRTFVLDRTFNGQTVMKKGGQGIEGITFVPDAKHSEGGTFLVTNQAFDLHTDGDLSAIVQVTLPLVTAKTDHVTVSIDRCVMIGVIDLSGIHYDASTNCVYVISDATNTMWELDRDLKVIAGHALPGKTQEGITVDPDGFAYIAQDEGGVVKLKLIR